MTIADENVVDGTDSIQAVSSPSRGGDENDNNKISIEESQEIEKLRADLALAVDKFENIEAEKTRLEQELQDAENKTAELSGKVEDNEVDLKSLRAELDAADKAAFEKDNKIQELMESKKSADNTTILEKELADVKKVKNVLQDTLKEMEEEKAVMGKELEEAKNMAAALGVQEGCISDDLKKATDELDDMQTKYRKMEMDLHAAKKALEKEKDTKKVDWEAKYNEEYKKGEAVHAELLEQKRLLKDEQLKTKNAEKDMKAKKQDIERIEAQKAKEEKKLRNEIKNLWDGTQKSADRVDSAVETARNKARNEDTQRIQELTRKLAESEREQNALKNRLATAEKEMATTKRKAKKAGAGGSGGGGGETERIVIAPMAREKTAVDKWKKALSSVTKTQVFVSLGLLLCFIQIFFPKLLTVAKK